MLVYLANPKTKKGNRKIAVVGSRLDNKNPNTKYTKNFWPSIVSHKCDMPKLYKDAFQKVYDTKSHFNKNRRYLGVVSSSQNYRTINPIFDIISGAII